jgi:hypothetical protein
VPASGDGEDEVLEENLTKRQFCPSQNPTWSDLGLNLYNIKNDISNKMNNKFSYQCFHCEPTEITTLFYFFSSYYSFYAEVTLIESAMAAITLKSIEQNSILS